MVTAPAWRLHAARLLLGLLERVRPGTCGDLAVGQAVKEAAARIALPERLGLVGARGCFAITFEQRVFEVSVRRADGGKPP